jgi:hypothetical protein
MQWLIFESSILALLKYGGGRILQRETIYGAHRMSGVGQLHVSRYMPTMLSTCISLQAYDAKYM